MSKPDTSSPSYRAALKDSLRWDDVRNEPYLQLPSFPELRLTPFREGIEDDLTTLFNHPAVGERLYRLPYPLPRSYAESWVARDLASHRSTLTQLLSLLPSPPSSSALPFPPPPDKHLLDNPFKSLRSTTVDRVLADINLAPHSYHFHPHPLTADEVRALPPPEQMWDLGYALDPAWHGKGIMGEMVAVLLEGWVRPWTGIGRVGAFCDSDNPRSMGVLKRNGMELVSTHMTDWPEDKGGGTKETMRYERSLL